MQLQLQKLEDAEGLCNELNRICEAQKLHWIGKQDFIFLRTPSAYRYSNTLDDVWIDNAEPQSSVPAKRKASAADDTGPTAKRQPSDMATRSQHSPEEDRSRSSGHLPLAESVIIPPQAGAVVKFPPAVQKASHTSSSSKNTGQRLPPKPKKAPSKPRRGTNSRRRSSNSVAGR